MNCDLDVGIDFCSLSVNDGNRLGSVDFDFIVSIVINGILLFFDPDN